MLKNIVLSYFRFLARIALSFHKPTIIGIAGSVGKSSARNALEAILKDHFPTKSVGNSETGIPLGILGMKPNDYSMKDWFSMMLQAPAGINFLKGTKYLIAEMGIDEPDPPKNMEYLLTILTPDIAIVLNESATHSMQFDKTVSDMSLTQDERLSEIIKNIAKEDIKIITKSGCKIGIYNADDQNLTEELKFYSSNERSKSENSQTNNSRLRSNNNLNKLLSFGTDTTNDLYYGDYSVNLEGTVFTLHKKDKGNIKLLLTFENAVLPKEYEQTFSAVILAAQETGLTLEQIRDSLTKHFILPKGRSSLIQGINNSVIIDSTYNASKTSMLAFLDLVYMLKRKTKRPVVFLFGDMRELGKEAKSEHEEVATKMIGIVDYLYCVGSLTREYVLPVIQKQEKEFREMRWFDKSTRAGEFLKDNLPKDAIVLAKGSQNTIFLEEAVKQILKEAKDASLLCRQNEYWIRIKQS